MDSAESEFRGMASKGLPGKETIEDDIQSQVARTMGLGKQVADSPSALLDLLSKSNEGATANMRQLGVQDASAQLGNRMQLAEFLSRAKAPMQAMIEDKNINLGISAERERMVGTQELLQGITQGMGGLAQGASAHMMDKNMKSQLEILKGFYGGFGGSDSSAAVPVPGNQFGTFQNAGFAEWFFKQNTKSDANKFYENQDSTKINQMPWANMTFQNF